MVTNWYVIEEQDFPYFNYEEGVFLVITLTLFILIILLFMVKYEVLLLVTNRTTSLNVLGLKSNFGIIHGYDYEGRFCCWVWGKI